MWGKKQIAENLQSMFTLKKKKNNLCVYAGICKGKVLKNIQQTLNSSYLSIVGQNVAATFKFHITHFPIFQFVTMNIYY